MAGSIESIPIGDLELDDEYEPESDDDGWIWAH